MRKLFCGLLAAAMTAVLSSGSLAYDVETEIVQTEENTEVEDGRTLPVVSGVAGDDGVILPDTVGEVDPSAEDGNGPETEFHLDIDYILSYDQEQCSDMIFFGDSRVVGMSYYAGGYHYVGKVSMGLSWMNGEGGAWLARMMSDFPQADVVLCFGINDLGNIGGYIQSYQALMNAYPQTRFWVMSVNPVSERSAAAAGYSVRNSMIESFNTQLHSAFPQCYIDCYSYLMQYGVESGDGVHYSGSTYAACEDFAWRAISRQLDERNRSDS